ncbi:MAG: AMP-binding protein, partial [Gemmatimonadota bacterium]|nr:AMP-binding protein [Gemmatimonadota bacterium]
MSALDFYANRTPVPESTLTDLFFEAVEWFGDAPAFQRFEGADRVVDISYAEALVQVRRVGLALKDMGFVRGDRVAILSENRYEWAIVDYGCLCTGVIVVPIYPTLTAPQLRYILEDSGSTLVFVSGQAQAEKVVEATEAIAHRVDIVAFDPASVRDVVAWGDFLERGEGGDTTWFRTEALEAEPHDVATVLYTSGTTGQPKGVMLTHNNIASNVRGSRMILPLGNEDNTISFLPLSHILQRMVDYLFFWTGCTIGYPRSLDTLIVDLKKLEPTVVVSVPRIYEKIY